MAASNKKIIVVVGATGNQGSSVAHTFLNLPHWNVRATTRNPSSPAAQALAARGAEVVPADLEDVSSLSKAFEDAHAIFLNTDFWTTYKPLTAEVIADAAKIKGQPEPSETAFRTEVSHGKNAAQVAAKVLTLNRFVYSALPPMKQLSGGKYFQSFHWESKAAIVEYIENDLPDLAKKTSFIYLGAYNTNPLLAPRLNPLDGKYQFVLPLTKDSRMPIIDPKESTGPFVRALIEHEQPGTKLLAYDTDSYLTMQEIVEVWSRASGKEASLVEVTVEFMHQQFGIPMEVLEAPAFIVESGYSGSMKVTEPSELTTKVQTKSYEEWMKGRDWKAILEVDKPAF